MGQLLPYFIPFGAALACGAVLRLAAGPAWGARVAGLSVFVGFAAAWQWLLLAPWVPMDGLTRVIHIAIGGFLFGLVLDVLQPGRRWLVVVAAAFAFGSVWSAITGALLGPPPDEIGVWFRLVLYLAAWGLLLFRLRTLQSEGPSVLAISLMLAIGLGLVGQMSGEGAIAAAAYCLAAAIAGYLALAWVLAVPLGHAVVLGCGGTLMGLGMALADPFSEASALALVVLLLVPFGDGTAKRVPLGPEAVRPFVYPLALMAVAVLPVAVSAILAFLLSGR